MRVVMMSAVAALAIATPAFAATVTDIVVGERSAGRPVHLDSSAFTGTGRCGYGGSVINDGCSVALKTDPTTVDAYGRHDPFAATWVDSQDLARLEWDYRSETPFSSLTFALTDAFDQACDGTLGCSYFRLLAGDIAWTISDRQDNGEVTWLTVLFDGPTTSALLQFETRLNDGYGVSLAALDAPPAPVPLPATAPLLGLAMAGLWFTRRRAAAQA